MLNIVILMKILNLPVGKNFPENDDFEHTHREKFSRLPHPGVKRSEFTPGTYSDLHSPKANVI